MKVMFRNKQVGAITKLGIGVLAVLAGAVVFGGLYGVQRIHKSNLANGSAYVAKGTPTNNGSDGATPAQSAPTAAPVDSNTLTVSIVSFHGYAPAILANGGSLKTQPGSIYAKLGLNLNLVVQDDIPTLQTVFTSKTAQCAWRTSDFWAQEQPNLRNAKLDARAVMIVDNTQGGDAIVARDPSVRTVEDLAGKKVALLQFTPSHGLLIDAINNSSLSAKKKSSIQMVFINADEGTAGVRAAFESGKVDAIVLWDPDLSLAMRQPGSHVVYSTKQATNLIYDVMVCNKEVIDSQQGHTAVQKFVQGWLAGVDYARVHQDEAVSALASSEQMFGAIRDKEGPSFIKGLFTNLVWTNLSDNARILGLIAGGTNHYERVYHEFDQIYREAGALANPNSPVINASDSFDYSFVKTLLARDASAQQAATVEKTSFTTSGATVAQSSVASLTKPVSVNFGTGSAELTKKGQEVIDKQIVPFLEDNGTAYIELSGNADSTGSDAVNRPLSLARANAAKKYLVEQWEIPAARLVVAGNGSSKPICREPGTEDGLSLEDCRAANRATRVAILQSASK